MVEIFDIEWLEVLLSVLAPEAVLPALEEIRLYQINPRSHWRCAKDCTFRPVLPEPSQCSF